MSDESWKIEVVFERGRMQVHLTKGPGQRKSGPPIWKVWLIDRMSWWAFGLAIATYVQTL